MPNIYVVCGGTSAANGFYTDDIGSYSSDKNSYSITYNSGYWNLKNDSDITLYRFAAASSAIEPLSETGWEIVSGSSPTIKTFNSSDIATVDANNNYVFGSVVVVGADQAAANGTYARSENNIWINSAGWKIQPYTNCNSPGIYNTSNTPIYYMLYGSPANGGNRHPATGFYTSYWEPTVQGGAAVPPSSSYYVDTAVCSAGGDENAGNNYTHSRILDVIDVVGAGEPTVNGSYYIVSENGGLNGSKIWKNHNNKYIIWDTYHVSWTITDTSTPGAILYYLGDTGPGPNDPPPNGWETYDGASPAPTSAYYANTRRFFIRRSGNNAYLRHTS